MAFKEYRAERVNPGFITRFYYWLKVFTEGQTTKDKLILLPGAIIRVIAYGMAFIRIPLLPRLLSVASRPPVSLKVKNSDGVFLCRKGKDDVFMAAKAFESPTRKYFEQIDSGVFVDVGANIGKYTVKVARQIGNRGKVISIEPDPETFYALKSNIALNNLTNVLSVNVACWNKDEELELYLAPLLRTTGSASVKNKVSKHFIKVKGFKLDDILKGLGIESANLIKIDAEGAEVEILEGTEETIAKSQNLKIIFEAVGKEHLEKCKQILEKHGMDIKQIRRRNFLAEKR